MAADRTYQLPPSAALPDFTALDGVATADPAAPESIDTTEADTADGRLARAGVTLRRSTGGRDAGWLLAVDDVEVRLGAGRGARTVPAPLVRLARGWTGGEPVRPVRHESVRTTTLTLRDPAGDDLATVLDALVTQTAPGGAEQVRREVTVRAGKAPLRTAVSGLLAGIGAKRMPEPAPHDVLAPVPRSAEITRNSLARTLLQAQLGELLGRLRTGELRVRLAEADSVHQLRITLRRLRTLLAVWAPLLDTDVSEPVRERLHAIGAVLGSARDAEVARERLVPLTQGEPAATRVGPVVVRVRRTLDAERKQADAAVRAVLDGDAHLALLAELDALADDPPLIEQPGKRVAKAVPPLLRRVDKRLHRRAAVLCEALEVEDAAVHGVRKAARRARYAAEAFAPVLGRQCARYAEAMEGLQDVLGERQDALAACRLLVSLAAEAHEAGENAFTYGRLHAAQSAHVEAADAAYPGLLTVGLKMSVMKG